MNQRLVRYCLASKLNEAVLEVETINLTGVLDCEFSGSEPPFTTIHPHCKVTTNTDSGLRKQKVSNLSSELFEYYLNCKKQLGTGLFYLLLVN
jgi:hypothetical protein